MINFGRCARSGVRAVLFMRPVSAINSAGSEVRGTLCPNEQLHTIGPAQKGADNGAVRGAAPRKVREQKERETCGAALVLFDVEKNLDRQGVRRQGFFVRCSGGMGFVRGSCSRMLVPTIVRCRAQPVRGKRAGRSRCGLYVASRAGAGRLSQIVQSTAKRTQRSRLFSLPTEKIYRMTGLSPHNTGKLYRPTRCRGLTTNRFPHRSPVEVESGRGWKRKSRLHTEKSP
jgi:hypothetical protein